MTLTSNRASLRVAVVETHKHVHVHKTKRFDWIIGDVRIGRSSMQILCGRITVMKHTAPV